MAPDLQKLREALNLCVLKKSGYQQSSSIAYSKSGRAYAGGLIESDTHLLHISSEQVVLCRAVQQCDYGVYHVATMLTNIPTNEAASPINIKILVDHSRRTGNKIGYTIVNKQGAVLFESDDVRTVTPFYKPEELILDKVRAALPVEENRISVDLAAIEPEKVLKRYALLGLERDFPISNTASGYATAVITKKGNLYFSGQYSSFEKRTSVHSEMGAVLAALMNKDNEIFCLGLLSTKYTDAPTQVCGICRQFLSEISSRFHLGIKIFCFAKDTDVYETHEIDIYLPNQWSSKKW